MGNIFNDLCQGLQEAIDYEKGEGPAKITAIRDNEVICESVEAGAVRTDTGPVS